MKTTSSSLSNKKAETDKAFRYVKRTVNSELSQIQFFQQHLSDGRVLLWRELQIDPVVRKVSAKMVRLDEFNEVKAMEKSNTRYIKATATESRYLKSTVSQKLYERVRINQMGDDLDGIRREEVYSMVGDAIDLFTKEHLNCEGSKLYAVAVGNELSFDINFDTSNCGAFLLKSMSVHIHEKKDREVLAEILGVLIGSQLGESSMCMAMATDRVNGEIDRAMSVIKENMGYFKMGLEKYLDLDSEDVTLSESEMVVNNNSGNHIKSYTLSVPQYFEDEEGDDYYDSDDDDSGW